MYVIDDLCKMIKKSIINENSVCLKYSSDKIAKILFLFYKRFRSESVCNPEHFYITFIYAYLTRTPFLSTNNNFIYAFMQLN